MNKSIVLLVLLLPRFALAQEVSESEAQAKLKQLVESGRQSTALETAPQAAISVANRAITPAPAPRQASTDEVLSGLARQVQKLRSKVSVTAATIQATQRPQAARSVGSKTYYNFREGAIYEVHAGVDRVTDIELQPGESLTNQPVSGDTVRWTVGTISSMTKLGEQTHLVVKPLEEALETNIIITTNRRVYHLRATSGDWYMPAIAWHYPDDDAAAKKAAINKKRDDEKLSLSPENLDFNYEILSDGESWTPIHCFDDGQKTYLQMPKNLPSGDAPALFLVDDESEAVLVNYRVKGDYYIIDRLFDRAQLRVGKMKPVQIFSSRKPRTFWEHIF